jgi:AbrB family looped-hinge helix DNA binding protein
VKLKVRLGPKGQLVIPKLVRESVGLRENGSALLEVKEKAIEIRPLESSDLVERAKHRAAKHGGDIKKLGWVYGDRLYEEVFQP